MHNSKLKKITVALCMALAPMAVFSAGLGKLNVSSGLGEPLKADIELLSVTPEELSSIFAAIASEEAYAIQGIERPASHNTIKVEVAKNANGAPILRLKSSQPIAEPFLDMLIQVDWASGRLLREYTVLLDPPGYKGEPEPNTQNSAVLSNEALSNPSTQLPVVKSVNPTDISNTPIASIENKKSTTNNTKQVKQSEADNSTDLTTNDYVTKRGDSLAKIAQETKPEGVSLDQMLVGLYQANPNAFDGKNMNRLKVGKIIRPPTEQELSALSRQQASKEVKVQSANWNEYRNRLAGIVAESAPVDVPDNNQSAEGKIKSAAEDQSATSTGPKDVVKLSAGEAALTKKEAEDVKSLQAKITALQEESIAREKSVKEAQEKTAALEKQIADMQQLITLKNNAMSDMQQQAEMQASSDNNTTEPNTAPVAADQSNQTESANTAVEPPASSVADAQVKPEVKPAPVIVTELPVEPSLLEGLDLPLLGAGAGLLALLGAGWLYLRNKRKRNLADFEQGIMTSGGLKANTVFGNTSGSSVDTGDTSFLTDFSQSANGGMIDTNDVDPIAEAEVYMAYGRDAQAEEILKDAISKEPKRYELHLKLLEMYAASKNVSAFETIAGELYTTLGAEDQTWAKVAEIGRKLEPSNPLYLASTTQTTQSEKLDADDFSDSAIASETDLDFSFENESPSQNAALSTNETDAFDLDLDALNKETDNQSGQFNLNTDSAVDFDDTHQNQLNAENVVNAESITENADASENNNGLDFNFGDLTTDVTQTNLQDENNFGHTMPGLNLSSEPVTQSAPELTMDFSESSADNNADQTIAIPELPSLDLADLNQSSVNNASLNMDATESDLEAEKSDFNFDLSTISPEASSYVEDASDANTYDLSSINLEMTDDSPQQQAPTEIANEPIEVETKLDLVSAYMEMGDAEGAKELLDEVMKEGGANQRKRAELLLAKLA